MSTISDAFDRIAPGWYNYRHRTRFRNELEALARRWRTGKLLNVGCAHGPDFLPFKDNFELHGIDISGKMLEMARRYASKYNLKVNLAKADVGSLPYNDESFDFAIAVAVYHHVEGKEERLNALRELHCILKPGGEVFLTVWNRRQPRFWLKPNNIRVPWRTSEDTLYRYYHLFSYGEIEKLVKKAGFEIIESSPEKAYKFPLKYFSRNICLLAKKAGKG
jgi:tRNA (uracil-5-)-methyltransferase TRM9